MKSSSVLGQACFGNLSFIHCSTLPSHSRSAPAYSRLTNCVPEAAPRRVPLTCLVSHRRQAREKPLNVLQSRIERTLRRARRRVFRHMTNPELCTPKRSAWASTLSEGNGIQSQLSSILTLILRPVVYQLVYAYVRSLTAQEGCAPVEYGRCIESIWEEGLANQTDVSLEHGVSTRPDLG